ncbi:MAG: MFS transporter [Dehalococcoidia bacterium]
MGPWLEATFNALRERNFRVLWTGSFLAFLAFFMSTVVQAVVAYDLTGNNRSVGFVVFAQGIAQLVLGPFGGAMADRFPKRLVILVCQSVITVSFVAVGVLIAADAISIPALAAASFVIGLAFSFLGPSRQALLMDIVGPARRGNAVALSQVALNASRILGPLLAAASLVFDWFGSAGAYFMMAALYVLAMWTTVLLPRGDPVPGAPRSVFGDIAEGVRYVWRVPRLRSLVLSYVLLIMVGFPYVTVLPGLVENELGRSSGSITILFAVNAVGGLLASLIVASLADSARAGIVYVVMSLVFGAGLIATGLSPNFLVVNLMMFVLGFGAGGFQTLNGAIVSHITDPAYFGRVVSLTFLAFAAFGVIALPIGVLADAIGERATLGVMGAGVFVIVLAFAGVGRSVPRTDVVEQPASLGPGRAQGG